MFGAKPRTQWMKGLLDSGSQHTMSCESGLGCMKAVNNNKSTACATEERSYALVHDILIEMEVQASD